MILKKNLYFIIISLPRTPAPPINQYCADESESSEHSPFFFGASNIQRHFTQQIASQCVSVSSTHSPLIAAEKKKAYFWCFDKVKCHWETKILLKAFLAASPLNSTWTCEHFMKNLCFYCFRHERKRFKREKFLANHMTSFVIFFLHLSRDDKRKVEGEDNTHSIVSSRSR